MEPVEKSFFPRDIALADVDNEGQQEVVCVGYGAYNNVLRFYKYRDGRYEVLKKAAQDAETTHTDTKDFLAAHVADINDDGQVEVISQPKPLGRIPPQNRYVWKWSEEQGVFRLLYEESLA